MYATAFPFDLIVEPGTNDMNVACRLCIAVHLCTYLLAVGSCHYYLDRLDLRYTFPLATIPTGGSAIPPRGVCKRTRGGMPGECRGTTREFTSLAFPLGGMPGEFPGMHQPWGNEQERNTLPLYSHCQGAMQLLDGKPSLMSLLV